jgi:glycosyltransferase involved in cell wall biosynthesis
MNSVARVSIITVNYNQVALTCALLDSLKKVTYPDVEVLVVDNGSPEDATPVITKNYPNVKFVRSNENLGFAGILRLILDFLNHSLLFSKRILKLGQRVQNSFITIQITLSSMWAVLPSIHSLVAINESGSWKKTWANMIS